MSVSVYYLGANTPEGFCSHYDTLFHDGRIRRLVILKGGPGCGKSTLMRHVSAAAQAKGMDAEEILCSSDPDSLDGLIVPQAGLALVDGTAPHVVEPPLCGLGAAYLDLGRFYDGARMEQRRDALLEAKEKNAACYPLCYSALRAAGAAGALLRALAEDALPPDTLDGALRRLLPPLPEASARPGSCLRRWVSALTPQGVRLAPPQTERCYRILDSYGLAGPLLRRLRDAHVQAGHSVIEAFDPLSPRELQALMLPEQSVCYLRSSRLFPLGGDAAPWLELDALVDQRLSYEQQRRLQAAEALRADAVQEALHHLIAAKAHHDALEAVCRPAVDFAGVAACAEALAAEL